MAVQVLVAEKRVYVKVLLAVKLWQEEEGEMLTEDKFEQEEVQTR